MLAGNLPTNWLAMLVPAKFSLLGGTGDGIRNH
jgi:hypothetical protein